MASPVTFILSFGTTAGRAEPSVVERSAALAAFAIQSKRSPLKPAV